MASDDANDIAEILQRITIAVHELNLLLRAAALSGTPTSIDTVDRTDAATKTGYPEILVQAQED